jgi:hypothetical protein
VINTYLRVHPIPGVVDFFDYSEEGIGLTYENGVMTPSGIVSGTPPGGVQIDGQPDAVTGAGTSLLPGFESVDGPQGALTMTQRLVTNNPDPAYHLDYRDGNVLNQDLCTGDDNELYGASGPQLNSAVNNTDEAGRVMWGGGQFSNLFYQRNVYYGAPGQANGPQRLNELQAPLDLAVQDVDLGEPTGTIVVRKNAVPDAAQDFSFSAGGGLSPATFDLDDDADGTLSDTQTFAGVPVGSGYSISESPTSGWYLADATCDDGSPVSNIDVSEGETVTCTFTNSVAYPRPGGATPLRVPLLPAYAACETPNSSHVGPLTAGSCAPPVQESSLLTQSSLGRGQAWARLEVRNGDPGTPADEADVAISALVSDVRNAGDGSDYGGSLILRTPMRVTDRANGGGNESATVTDASIGVPVDCQPTASADLGGSCSVSTTIDTLVPGFARERKFAVISTFQLSVEDAGADGTIESPGAGQCPLDCGSGDERPFLMQGVFAP